MTSQAGLCTSYIYLPLSRPISISSILKSFLRNWIFFFRQCSIDSCIQFILQFLRANQRLSTTYLEETSNTNSANSRALWNCIWVFNFAYLVEQREPRTNDDHQFPSSLLILNVIFRQKSLDPIAKLELHYSFSTCHNFRVSNENPRLGKLWSAWENGHCIFWCASPS
jgi:hypothetical protein